MIVPHFLSFQVMPHNYSPALKKGGYIGFGLSVIPSIHLFLRTHNWTLGGYFKITKFRLNEVYSVKITWDLLGTYTFLASFSNTVSTQKVYNFKSVYLSVHLSVIIFSLPLNILKTLLLNLSRFCMCIVIGMI